MAGIDSRCVRLQAATHRTPLYLNQKKLGSQLKLPGFSHQMAERTGLEPATPGVTGRYSNQLNYRSGKQKARDVYRSPQWLVGAAGLEPATFAL